MAASIKRSKLDFQQQGHAQTLEKTVVTKTGVREACKGVGRVGDS